ncbi:hypothetical protein DFH06DRAFT_1369742 [Mycena polygramma]|nr:hypothetical protein DFH06DRAFT_1369742 [Mycena polygramma]
MTPLSLSDIPLEMLSEILRFLDPKTLLLCSSVCRLWHETVKRSAELQYTIELWADGMVRGDSDAVTSADALAALLKHRRAWSIVEWRSKTVVEIEPLVACRAYELVGGIFAQQQQGADFLTISLADMVGDRGNARTTHAMGQELPNIQDFAMEPTQDLLALFSATPGGMARLELRTISSQQPHPLAGTPHFEIRVDDSEPISVQIAGDVIGIFFPEPVRVLLLNWRSGFILADMDHPESISDFYFLSPRSYILAHIDDEEFVGEIDIWTFDGLHPDSSTLVARLLLPEIVSYAFTSLITIQAGPFRAKPSSSGTTPFSKSNDNRIYMFLINYCDEYLFRLIVHGRYFQQFVTDYLRENRTEAAVVLWEGWGPQNSRMFPGGVDEWDRQVHGERVALPCQNPSGVQVLDFGIIPRREVDHQPTLSTKLEIELHLEPSTLEVENLFPNPVTTALPYRRTIRSLDREEHNLFLIDEDRLIGMNVDDSTPSHHMTVYTL